MAKQRWFEKRQQEEKPAGAEHPHESGEQCLRCRMLEQLGRHRDFAHALARLHNEMAAIMRNLDEVLENKHHPDCRALTIEYLSKAVEIDEYVAGSAPDWKGFIDDWQKRSVQ